MIDRLLPFCLAATLAAADFYVAPNGSDQWSGRLPAPNAARSDGPFATLTRARDAVRQAPRTLRIELREGTYTLTEPLTLTAADSAPDGHTITWAAYPGESPVISGGRELHGWQRKTPNSFRWTLNAPGEPAFRELWINGQRRPRARTPNEGFFYIEEAFGPERTFFRYAAGDVAPWKNIGDAEIVLFHDWEVARMPLARVDPAARLLFFAKPVGYDIDTRDFNAGEPRQRYYLENALELLDRAGEWYHDRHSGLLTHFAMRGEDLTTAHTVIPIATQLLRLDGARNLRFTGLRFEYTAFPLPDEGYAGLQASLYARAGDKWKLPPPAIELTNAHGCRIDNCRIVRHAAAAIGLRRGCRDNVIEGNEIADTGSNGIQIGEPAGEQPQDVSSATPADPSIVIRGNVVRNNHLHHTGRTYFGAVGIWIGFAQATLIEHNVLNDMPYTGISAGWAWDSRPTACRENRIEYNHIHHVMQMLSDGGGIYTLGWQPGTVLRGNLIHDTDRLHGRADQNGIFFDEGSKGFLVEDNVIFGNPGGGAIRFNRNEPSGHTFRNNSFGILPDDPRFPVEKARKAGCNPCGSVPAWP